MKKMIQAEPGIIIHVLKASNGKEAIEVIPKNMPNIIMSDALLPENNGFEFTGFIN